MKVTDFSFNLPEALVAQRPPAERGQSRLMTLSRSTGRREHRRVAELPDILAPDFRSGGGTKGPLLVFNNSRVRKARLLGRSLSSGASVEFLLLERRDGHTWLAMTQRARRRRPGSRYIFAEGLPGETEGEIAGAEGEFRLIAFDRPVGEAWLERYGHIPLPPYIRRGDTPEDAERYQTVYAEDPAAGGDFARRSAAAPTAGLHFTDELLAALAGRGIEIAFVTLHVGLGTFLPVRVPLVEDHRMHEEFFFISPETAAAVENARAGGRRIIAVGTTSLRALESAWEPAPQKAPGGGRLRQGEGTTGIFIYPGYTFKAADALFTNFHTPQSTLLMLVSAFAGREFILESYAEAVREGYRFFSYGDAMLIL